MPQSLLLVTTGPESSGKTTLARALAHILHAPLVDECSRPYLDRRRVENPAWGYQERDLHGIALDQRASEAAALRGAPPLIVCDTDLLVLRIWSQEKYQRIAPELEQLIQASLQHSRLFLLCSPDMPWEPDPLRENPNDRWRLFDLYKDTLEQLSLPHLILSGPHEQRLQTVLSHLQSASSSM